jgi:predicted DNA binding CopG/RHH family protein
MADTEMRTEYDFSASRPNPYTKRLKKQITIRIDEYTIDYFKEQAANTGIPYQSLINLYLSDCAACHKTLNLAWE